MTAHDVRYLKACTACGELGDNRTMVKCMVWGCLEQFHDTCAVEKFGNYVLKLPAEELDKISIKAAGVELMRKIMELRK